MIPNVVPLHHRMTSAEFDAERNKLAALYGGADAKQAEVVAKRDQAWAQLFARSGWTQEELAEKVGKSQKWVDLQLRFGRFLHFSTNVLNADITLNDFTEGRFRDFWSKTDKTAPKEEFRFRAVLKLMENARVPRPRIAADIVKRFGDGKWHEVETIARAFDTDIDHVDSQLNMMLKYETHGARAGRKSRGTSHCYQIFKQDKKVSAAELVEKLTPIITGLEAQGRASAAAASPMTVAVLAAKLKKLVEEWAQ